MFKRLFSIVTGDYPLEKAAGRFGTMLELAREMILEADAVYWGKELDPESRTALYDKDVRSTSSSARSARPSSPSSAARSPATCPMGCC